ncbi:MAG: type II toxin-antitoxin system Phd/YefM family antitoxin [Deltaproteobacteria bacterium]|nr:type II toxin-antitoxin system Phd/YefM family antitoxin [Deltaproteobacteria bacterium]
MKPSQDIRSITEMKTGPAELIQTVSETHKPIIITQNGEARAVLIDIQTYEKNRETTLLLKLMAQGIRDVEAGRHVDQDRLFDRLEKRLKCR